MSKSVQLYNKNEMAGWMMALALALSIPAASAQISFTDATVAAGVAHQSETYGASWGDLNGDGYPDLFVSNHRTRPSLFLNNGNGTFLDIAKQVRTWVYHKGADTHGGSWVDFDSDGDQDLLVSTGAGNPSQFLVNENGALIDRTLEYQIDIPKVSARLPVWIDYNGDRLPDFVMANKNGTAKVYRQVSSGTFSDSTGGTKLLCTGSQYGQLYDVNGDGRLDYLCPDDGVFPLAIYNTLPLPWQILFDSAAPNSLIPLVYHVADDIIGDFNNDQRLDFFLLTGTQQRPSSAVQSGANYFESQLMGGTKGFKFVSNGTVTFNMDWNQADEGTSTDLSRIQIGATGWHPTAIPFSLDPSDPTVAGMPPATTNSLVMQIGYDKAAKRWTLVLYAGDRFSEAYLQISSTATITNLQSTGLWAGDKPARPTLLMNYSGGFSDETVAAGLSAKVQCGSVTAGDFDNDMDLDLYLACRTGASNIPNILYENQGNGTFVAVPSAGGATGPVGVAVASGAGTADSVITADYDVDGFLDLFVTNGLNLRPLYYGGPVKLFRNKGNANHWIELQLVGTSSERHPIGARIKATANGVTQLRVLNDGYHRWSQEHTPSHFGLAGATTVDLRVEWPSGTVETFNDVAADKLYRITEGRGIEPFTTNSYYYTLNLGVTGTGSGTVSGGGTYNYGDSATVTATADEGSTFTGWSGPDGAECDTGTVTMITDKSCIATFTLNTTTNTGFKAPTANLSDGGGDGNGYEIDPANAYTNDGLSAVDTNSGTNTNTTCTNNGKDKHRYYNFGFNIPTESIIKGLEVQLQAKADSAKGSPKICVQVSWDGGASWTTAKNTKNLGTSLSNYTLGTSTDTWGRAWNANYFTNSKFRVRVINVSSSTARDFRLDMVSARVTYK